MRTTPYGLIYVALCTATEKKYVGQTIQSLAARWKRHLRDGDRGYLFGRALAKHGSHQFIVAVVDTAESQEDLNAKEMLWIKTLGTLSPAGYNLTEGGSRGKQSEESKERNRISHSGRKPCPLALERAALSHRGKPRSDETKRKISAAKTGRKLSPDHAAQARTASLGKKRTPEQVEKMRQVHVGRKRSPETCEKIRQAMRALRAKP